ncbi:MAG: hypothetical protein ACRC7O_11035 [Fimbriiglobus sp.]
MPVLDAAEVGRALGGEPAPGGLDARPGPLVLFALRSELLRRRQSTGGRPGIAGAAQRVKIPVTDGDWHDLEAIAASLSADGFAPSAGQVASVLLNLAIRSVKEKGAADQVFHPLATLLTPRAAEV